MIFFTELMTEIRALLLMITHICMLKTAGTEVIYPSSKNGIMGIS